ncbi:hypothetical protein [Pseudoalteromonas spongiae]|uniref:hypothetical protein n=1 Tax=Pseudoalteromonas spongiae TaxID=298657 RepID=UPI000C2D0ED3|nr:hypothetical protein [Pseudoalteromonas spongiae]
MRILFVATTILLASCDVNYKAWDELEIQGDGSREEKLLVAKSISEAVDEGGLRYEIRTKFPELVNEDLNKTLFVSWSITEHLSEKGISKTNVSARCEFTNKSSYETGVKVVSICKNYLKDELAARAGVKLKNL